MKQNQIKEDHTNVLDSHQASFVEFILLSPFPSRQVFCLTDALVARWRPGRKFEYIRKPYSFSLIDSPSSGHSCKSRNEKEDNMGKFQSS